MRAEDCAALLARQDQILLVTHRNPDGDTMGSAAALCSALRRVGKTAFLLPNPQVIAKLLPFVEPWYAPTGFAASYTVAVDVAAEKMFSQSFSGPVDLCVDHHPSNSHYAAAECIDAERAACGEIVYDLLCELGVELTVPIAEALYVAVSTDTGCFRHSNVTANTFRVAAALLEAGVDAYPINRRMFELKRFARLKLEAYLTETMRFYAGGRIGVCLIPADIRERLGLTEDDVDDISGFARMIEGVELAAMLRQMPDGVKLSLRSGRLYDAGAICLRLGGGGHFSAAGATLHPDPAEAERQLLEAIYALYPELCPAES